MSVKLYESFISILQVVTELSRGYTVQFTPDFSAFYVLEILYVINVYG